MPPPRAPQRAPIHAHRGLAGLARSGHRPGPRRHHVVAGSLSLLRSALWTRPCRREWSRSWPARPAPLLHLHETRRRAPVRGPAESTRTRGCNRPGERQYLRARKVLALSASHFRLRWQYAELPRNNPVPIRTHRDTQQNVLRRTDLARSLPRLACWSWLEIAAATPHPRSNTPATARTRSVLHKEPALRCRLRA